MSQKSKIVFNFVPINAPWGKVTMTITSPGPSFLSFLRFYFHDIVPFEAVAKKEELIKIEMASVIYRFIQF